MKITEDINLPLTGGYVIVIGNFDGVHTGHRQLMREARRIGAKLNLPVLVWTFKKHPASLYLNHRYISTLSERLSFFEEEGASCVYLADFDKYKDIDGDEFVEKWLVNKFKAKCVVCGFNFTYGKNKSGNAQKLENRLEKLGVDCFVMPPFYVDGEIVSSTCIRKYISEGNMKKAASFLGRPYSFTLPVVHGNAYGRTIGVPTANLVFPEWRVIPAFGVYASVCRIDGEKYPSISNVGMRPTIEEEKKVILCETHILGQDIDLYDRALNVSLLEMLRKEVKFDSFDSLVSQVRSDVETAKRFFEMK